MAGTRDEKTEADCILPNCPACGRPFGRKPSLTIAAWFTFGTPRPEDIVHWGCRFTRRPKAARLHRLRLHNSTGPEQRDGRAAEPKESPSGRRPKP